MKHGLGSVVGFVGVSCLAVSSLTLEVAEAQLTDKTQTPNTAGEGINKSFSEEIGLGRGNVLTPDSSLFIVKRDPFRAIRRGRQIFQRKFTVSQGLGPRTFDGVGDIEIELSLGAGIMDSCAGCHGRPRGSAGAGGDVFTRPDSRDAPHLFGLGLVEQLADEITSDLRVLRALAITDAQSSGFPATRLLSSKGISYGRIRAFPNGSVDTSLVEGVNPDLRVRPFFHQGGTMSIREFVVGAFNAEMGLEAFDPDTAAAAAGGIVVTPSGMILNGTIDSIEAPPVTSVFDDSDGDGVVDEIPVSIVDFMEFYLLNYFKAGTYIETPQVRNGRTYFAQVGCTECHVPNLRIDHDRRVADVETVYDETNGIFNNLFSTASARLVANDDGSGHPTLKTPELQPFVVENIYADFKRHDLGPNFHERNFDGTVTTLFMTEPLWGVATTAPYGHDGRSVNLREVILRHGGEAQAARDAFAALKKKSQSAIIQFLESLVLFPPDDTASNLNPGNPATPGFPQKGHGSISLTVLFNDPSDPE